MTYHQGQHNLQGMQMAMQSPQDLFIHLLSDIHSAEQIIVEMLGEAQQLVQHPQLKQALQQHEQESRQQAANLRQIFQQLGAQPHPVTCHAAAGLRQSLREVAQSRPSPEVLNGAVVAGGCETEHLEIAAYAGLIEKAQALGQQPIVQLLQQNLQQEQQTLQKLEQIGRQLAQQMAAQMQGSMTSQQSTSSASSPM